MAPVILKQMPALCRDAATGVAVCLAALTLFLAKAGAALNLTATGHEKRIDVVWDSPANESEQRWIVWRSSRREGPFVPIRTNAYTVCSDFIGENGRTFWYAVTSAGQNPARPTDVGGDGRATATSRAMSDDDLLSSVQEATFRYFWQGAHPVSGLAREGSDTGDKVTTGGTGFGIMAIVVASQRGFVPRASAAERILRQIRFLEDKAARYHGAWAHWLDGRTGQTRSFSKYDDGGDIVETAYLIQGLLTARQYFDRDTSAEKELRERATRLWREVDWNWYRGEPPGEELQWHWSPNHGWKMNHRIGNHFNECLITYVLALASPTHPIPPQCYTNGWIVDPAKFLNGNSYFGIRQAAGWPMGGPLFFTHYSFLGFDPRPWSDPLFNYFENNRAIARIHHAYAVANPGRHAGYGDAVWGLTASRGPDGYRAFEPRHDNGTIAPTAALSSMPYTPRESLAALKYFYHQLGARLWGDFGFRDAFNLDRNWFEPGYLAIDQGPIIVMIENYRTGLCWRLFMANGEIVPALKRAGWHSGNTPPPQ